MGPYSQPATVGMMYHSLETNERFVDLRVSRFGTQETIVAKPHASHRGEVFMLNRCCLLAIAGHLTRLQLEFSRLNWESHLQTTRVLGNQTDLHEGMACMASSLHDPTKTGF